MNKDGHIDFVLIARVKGMHLQPHRPDGVEFNPVGKTGLRFVLRPEDPENDGSGHRTGLSLKVYKSFLATQGQISFVEAYNNTGMMTRVADGISLPFKPRDEILIFEDGTCAKGFSPRRRICPADIVELIQHVECDLVSEADRFLRLLRWRQNFDAESQLISSSSLYWRVGDAVEYHLVPLENNSTTTVSGMFGMHWSEEHSADLQALWSTKNHAEPLGHALLREAATLASSSPRSSILIMVAALETAIKVHISKVAPQTSWLMQEVPSPPVFKILRDYIPLIHNNSGFDMNFWSKVNPSIKKAQKLIEIRNKVAHTGNIPPDAGSIFDALELVSDFLYLLDVLDGHDWAKSHVNYELRNAFGWPAPKELRLSITISEGY
jgi:hypothetical protein